MNNTNVMTNNATTSSNDDVRKLADSVKSKFSKKK